MSEYILAFIYFCITPSLWVRMYRILLINHRTKKKTQGTVGAVLQYNASCTYRIPELRPTYSPSMSMIGTLGVEMPTPFGTVHKTRDLEHDEHIFEMREGERIARHTMTGSDVVMSSDDDFLDIFEALGRQLQEAV